MTQPPRPEKKQNAEQAWEQTLERNLERWANSAEGDGSPGAQDAFLARLADIPNTVAQKPRQPIFIDWVLTAVKAAGGWGFAAPQLAGLVIAAYLGVLSGAAEQSITDEVYIDESISAHIFGADLFFGDAFDSGGFDDPVVEG
ncbi:MAG: hypothetical protein AAF607_08960 [Pseudomonadota bacterium]